MNPSGTSDLNPPPLPPRPLDYSMQGAHMANNMYGGLGYNNQYGYGMRQFGGMGMYNNAMMPYGGGYGGYGMGQETDFARLAEESSRGAFQSIESVVNAVTSVANMLSSTHNAVYSSFRAVIGVVEQFSHLKTQISTVILSLSIFKFLTRVWKNLLVFLRLKPQNYASIVEEAWGEVKQPYGSDLLGTAGAPAVSWPTVLFWAVAVGGPYLIYKCIDQMVRTVEEKRKWATGTGSHYSAETLFNFQAGSEQELSFMKGDVLRVAPKEEQPRLRGWLMASTQDGSKIGLVPINYIRIVGRKSESPPPTGNPNINKFEAAFR